MLLHFPQKLYHAAIPTRSYRKHCEEGWTAMPLLTRGEASEGGVSHNVWMAKLPSFTLLQRENQMGMTV